jgi:hypothetical protein
MPTSTLAFSPGELASHAPEVDTFERELQDDRLQLDEERTGRSDPASQGFLTSGLD